jgi:hypothetical protein
MENSSGSKDTNPLEYYARPGMMTDPQAMVGFLGALPSEVSALRQIVQGVSIHIFWAERYGVSLQEERKEEVQIRSVSRKLKRILELDNRPLTVSRSLEKRLVGNCRDFSIMLCAFLRHHGVPSRARCGFGAYFLPNHFEDHWVCEYWKDEKERWVMVDAQLDSFQCEKLSIQFDPLDVPLDQFLIAGRAWQLCRAGQADPDQFGIFDMHGMWFIRGNLLRDLAALNKVELLPWDGWGLIEKEEQALSTTDMALLDHVAELTLADNSKFHEMRSTYENDAHLRVPPIIRSYSTTGVRTVEIAA